MTFTFLPRLLITLSLLILSANTQIIQIPLNNQENLRLLDEAPGTLSTNKTNNGHSYITTVKLGSNKTEFNMIVDTTSSISWVPGPLLKKSFKNTLNCTTATNCHANEQQEIWLPSNQVKLQGHLISEEVTLGSLTLPKFNMILAKGVNTRETDYFQGYLGLALGSSYDDYPTVLDSLKDAGLIKEKVFSVYMGDKAGPSGEATGELVLGGYNPKYTDSDFQFVPVKSGAYNQFWKSEASMQYGTIAGTRPYPVIFSTLSHSLVVPPEFLELVVRMLTKKGLTIDDTQAGPGVTLTKCSAMHKLEDIIFSFGDVHCKVPPSSYVRSATNEICYLALVSSENSEYPNSIVLGEPFFQNYYTVFNADEKKIGLKKVRFEVVEPVVHYPWFKIIYGMFLFSIAAAVAYHCFKKWKASGGQIGGQSGGATGGGAIRGRGVAIGGTPQDRLRGQIPQRFQQFNDEDGL